MIEVNEAKLKIISRDDRDTPSSDMLKIITDSDTYCPSVIGLKNHNEYKDEYGRRSCDFMCNSCWKNSLQEVDDFVIKWKYKGSDEYV